MAGVRVISDCYFSYARNVRRFYGQLAATSDRLTEVALYRYKRHREQTFDLSCDRGPYFGALSWNNKKPRRRFYHALAKLDYVGPRARCGRPSPMIMPMWLLSFMNMLGPKIWETWLARPS